MNSRSFLFAYSTAWLLALGVVNFVCGQGKPPLPAATIDQILTGAEARQARIKNVRVTYSMEYTKLLDLPETGGKRVFDPQVVTFAFAGDRCYVKMASSAKGKPNQAIELSFDGLKTFTYFSGQLNAADGKNSSCDGDIYCGEFLNIPLGDRERTQPGLYWYFPPCLRMHSSRYFVHAQMDQIDGHACYVLEYPKFDKIWLDPDLGFVIRRREQFNPMDDRAVRTATWKPGDFVQAEPGLWVPMSGLREEFSAATNLPQFWDRKYVEARVKVMDLKLNQVTDQDFEIEIPPGTIVGSEKGVYRIKGDKAILLDELEHAARDELWAPSRWPSALTIGGAAAVVLVLCLLGWRFGLPWLRKRRLAHPRRS